jgi:predicted RNA-binding Zn-ribbon protein involved in translation (DUF1610 family)
MADEGKGAKTLSVSVRTADDQRIKLRCPICGAEEWTQGNAAPGIENFQPAVTANSSKGLIIMPVTQFFCGNCGYSLQFANVESGSIEVATDA